MRMLSVAVFLSMAAALAAASDLPDPYARSGKPTIGPASVPVMEQVFWVQMELDPAVKVEVTCPAGVRLLDKTKPGKNRQWTRFYFRSDRGTRNSAIVFEVEGAGPTRVPLTVLTYREDIEEKSRGLPGFSTDARKRGRSFYTDALIARAKANMTHYPNLQEELQRASRFDRLDDEQLWRCWASWNVPRQVYSNWPCPYCGEKIYAKNAFYPWIVQRELRCKCPVCSRTFPSNEIGKDDYTSGEFPDDGWGWDSTGSGLRKDAYGWVAYASHSDRIGGINQAIRSYSLRALLLGDKDAARRAGLLLARMAYVYPGMDARWQQVKKVGSHGMKVSPERQWEANRVMQPAMEAYDAIWELLGQDQALADFLRRKDPSIRTPEDVRRLIDVYLVQQYGLNRLRNWYGGDNGGWEAAVVHTALCANMGSTSDSWLRTVFTRAWNTVGAGGGFQDACLVNYLTREGITNIGNLNYSTSFLRYSAQIADCLERYPDPSWRRAFNLYDATRFPRVRAMFDAYLDLRITGTIWPQFGDSFSWRRGGPRTPNLLRETYYLRAYQHWPTDRLAWELSKTRRRGVELFEPDLWPQIDAQAKRAGPAKPLGSRVLDGVGQVILESRPGDPDPKNRAGLAIRYGYGWGHSHQDNLNVEWLAKGEYVVPELGYTNWVHPLGSTTRTVHHVTGMIDRKEQYRSSAVAKGTLETFAAAPEASFAEISAQPAGFPAKVYRRAAALLDAPGGNSYVFDVFRLKGGTTRSYVFHGPPDGGFDCPLPFGKKGAPIFTNLMEPQEASSDGDFAAVWRLRGKPLTLRLHMLGAPGRRYTTARFGKVDSPPIRFLLAEETKPDAASQFVAIWETYANAPPIEQIERLPLAGALDREGFEPVAVRVTLAGGQVETLIYSQDPRSTHHLDDFEFQGVFGYVSRRQGAVRALHLVGGGKLLVAGRGIKAAGPPYTAKIAAVDLRANTITLDRKLPADGTLDGKQMQVLAGGQHRTSYRIERVLPPGNVVELGLSAEIFQAKLDKLDPKARAVVCEIEPPLEAGSRFRFPPGYYNGAMLTDESRTARYRVLSVNGKTIQLDRAPKPEDFEAKDVLDRKMVHIYDFAERDAIAIDGSVFARLGDNGKWETKSTSEFQMLLRQ